MGAPIPRPTLTGEVQHAFSLPVRRSTKGAVTTRVAAPFSILVSSRFW